VKGAIGRSLPVVLLALPALAIVASPRAWQQETFLLALITWLAVALGTLLPGPPLPRSAGGRLAVSGLAALAVLTAVSLARVGVLEPAADATVLVLLYAGVVLAGFAAFRARAAARLVEPTLLATIVGAAAWGVSERILPTSIELSGSPIALGRLAEPLGYWNAMGALCGLGLILAMAIGTDRSRTGVARVLAAATVPLLATAITLTFSRGALAATLAGLLAAVALARTRSSAGAFGAVVASLVLAAIALEPLEGVRDLSLAPAVREADGAILGLTLLGLTIAAAGSASALIIRGRRRDRAPRALPPGLAKAAALAAVAFAIAPFASVLAGQAQSTPQQEPSGADVARLASAESLRSDYWDVALDLFRSEPIFGPGAGSFREEWMRTRRDPASPAGLPPSRNAHSLVIETLGELGIAGLVALLAFAAGIAACCRRIWRSDRQLAVGPTAGLVAVASHAAIDWDWQVPGLTIPAMLLAGLVLSGAEPARQPRTRRSVRGATALVAVVVSAWFAWDSYAMNRYHAGREVVDAARLLGWNDDRWERARDLLERSTTANPDANPLTDLALAAAESGRPREAIAAANRLVDANPESWFAWWLLARVSRESAPSLAAKAETRASQLRSQRLHR